MAPAKNELAERAAALGLSIAEIARLSGYQIKSLYNVSGGHQPLTAQLDSFLMLLEILQRRNELESVIGELKVLKQGK